MTQFPICDQILHLFVYTLWKEDITITAQNIVSHLSMQAKQSIHNVFPLPCAGFFSNYCLVNRNRHAHSCVLHLHTSKEGNP